MRKSFSVLSAIAIMAFATSCKKDITPSKEEISPEVIAKIKAQGFSTDRIVQRDGGYIVEGDIFLSAADLDETATSPVLRIAEVEQYRTTNLVKNLPRTITISVSNLPAVYSDAANEAIARYNAENLLIKFQRVASNGNIGITGFYEGVDAQGFITLGSAGFPTRKGDPYRQISMNTHPFAYGSNPDMLYIASVLQHEIGHCIGFRHTDYMNRAYSCGAAGAGNEGAGNIGAVHIPGTPTGPDNGSWMLACSNGNNRTFNNNDKIALNYLY
jgi:Dual-action HEIGH metallo-peptidase